jgi:hypothetical protein
VSEWQTSVYRAPVCAAIRGFVYPGKRISSINHIRVLWVDRQSGNDHPAVGIAGDTGLCRRPVCSGIGAPLTDRSVLLLGKVALDVRPEFLQHVGESIGSTLNEQFLHVVARIAPVFVIDV